MAAAQKKLRKSTIIFAVIFIIIVLIIIACNTIFKKKFQKNPPEAVGNTAGNISNGGDFCEYDGYIYYSNPADKNRLYRMKTDGTGSVKLSDDTVHNINVYGDYIFYSKQTKNIAGGISFGISRCRLNGKDIESLSLDVISEMILAGNTLYYLGSNDRELNHVFTYDIITGKTDKLSDDAYSPVNINNQKMYYANVKNNHYIYCYDINNGSTSEFLKTDAYRVNTTDRYTYYIDLRNNYSLIKVDNFTKESQTVFEGEKNSKCVNYNVYDDVIFYIVQGTDNYNLYRINADGTNNELVVTDTIKGVYCTSKYSFATVSNSTKIYMFPTKGKLTVELLKVQ